MYEVEETQMGVKLTLTDNSSSFEYECSKVEAKRIAEALYHIGNQ
jgi:hypothetical protein